MWSAADLPGVSAACLVVIELAFRAGPRHLDVSAAHLALAADAPAAVVWCRPLLEADAAGCEVAPGEGARGDVLHDHADAVGVSAHDVERNVLEVRGPPPTHAAP